MIGLGELRPARADEPVETDDLAPVDGEIDVLVAQRRWRRLAQLEHRRSRRAIALAPNRGSARSRPIIRRTRSCRPMPAIARLSQALRPSRSTVTRSQICCTSSSLWLTNTCSTPSSRSRRSRRRGPRSRAASARRSARRAAGCVERERQRLGDLDELHLGDASCDTGDRAGRCRARARRASGAPRR